MPDWLASAADARADGPRRSARQRGESDPGLISRRPDHGPSVAVAREVNSVAALGWLEGVVVQGVAYRLVPVHQSQCVGSIFVKVCTQAGIEQSREIIRHTLGVPDAGFNTECRSAGCSFRSISLRVSWHSSSARISLGHCGLYIPSIAAQ